MSQGTFNAVAILDALPEGENNTALRISEELKDIRDYKVDGLNVLYFRLDYLQDLRVALNELHSLAVDKGLKPWLHLEAHGFDDETGFLLGSGKACSWSRLKELLIPLNVATELNLVLILAACFGGSFARAIDTTKRAPVLALVGPTQQLTNSEIEVDFQGFYQHFFETESLRDAIDKLTSRSGERVYYRTSAEHFFYVAWHNYKTNHCSPSALRKRARLLRRRYKQSDTERVPGVASLERRLQASERTQFEKFCKTYFMYDLYPENRMRFPVTYELAETFVKQYPPDNE